MKQLSVFVENEKGSLKKITSCLAKENINIRAVTSSDTPRFAILRLIVDDVEKAKKCLTKYGVVARINEVIGVELKDKEGNLNEMLTILEETEINLDYIYSFVIRNGEIPVLVFHSDDMEKTKEVLKRSGIKIVEDDKG